MNKKDREHIKATQPLPKMPPTPKSAAVMQQQRLLSRTFSSTPDDDIVLSGVSGKFPNSRNVAEFESNLYNKVGVSKM